ncbi:MAG TPA: energy transducer TonB [Sphingomicrobium sp.]|nr:energy transducer TonB [Sphingomicrobium sp.]
MSGNRTVAIIIVALLHAVLGYALITGLAYNVIKKAAEDLKTFNVEEEPPPPEELPPPPEEQPRVPPPPQVAAPPPLVRTNVTQSPVVATPNPPPPVITPVATPAPPAPPAPPPPPPPPPPVRQVEPKSAVGNLQGLIRDTDYPESAIEREEQGTVTVSLQIGTTGRVTGCNVSSSSGSRTLDQTTCRILQARARFSPAVDSNGNPTTGTFSQRITWRLQ